MSGRTGSKRTMRRRLASIVAVGAVATLPMACGDDDGSEGPAATDSPSGTSSAATSADATTEPDGMPSDVSSPDVSSPDVSSPDQAIVDADTSEPAVDEFPATIEHKFGTTTIPDAPQRVVALGFNEQDFVLALGVEPVAVREYIGGYDFERRPWAQELVGDDPPPTVGGQEINVEAVAAADPDLILGVYSFMERPDYQQLSKIAPTVAQSGEYPDGGVPWDEQLRVTGEALGLTQKAERVIADIEREFASASGEHPEFSGATIAVALYMDGDYYVLEPSDLRFRFFSELGFEAPSETGPISKEQIELLDQEVVVILGATRDELADDPLLAGLDATSEGRVVFFGGFDTDMSAALGFGSPLSLSFAVETAVPLLAAAIDGDPSTPVDDAPLWES